jgi:hypothetical protein
MTLLFAASACVTSGFTGDRVLETSHPDAPEWVSLESSTAIPKEQNLRVVHRSSQKILSLPLGIKQEQLQALETSKTALAKHAGEMLEIRVGPDAMPKLDPQFKAALAKAHDANASVKDMYYEKVAGEPEYYRVQILVEATPQFIPALFRDLHGKLQSSREKNSRDAAEKIRDLFQ